MHAEHQQHRRGSGQIEDDIVTDANEHYEDQCMKRRELRRRGGGSTSTVTGSSWLNNAHSVG